MTKTATIENQRCVEAAVTPAETPRLLSGEILLETHPYTTWGGSVTARMHVPRRRPAIWQELTHYPRWVEYFPDIVQSEVLEQHVNNQQMPEKRLYQAACKNFLLLPIRVEVYLRVCERVREDRSHQIQFRLEKGSFADFSANLLLEDWQEGTLLTYAVRATPLIPIPGQLVQQAIRLDLPTNMQRMRSVLCAQ